MVAKKKCNNKEIIIINKIKWQFTAQSLYDSFASNTNTIIPQKPARKTKVECANFLPGPSGYMAERSGDGT